LTKTDSDAKEGVRSAAPLSREIKEQIGEETPNEKDSGKVVPDLYGKKGHKTKNRGPRYSCEALGPAEEREKMVTNRNLASPKC